MISSDAGVITLHDEYKKVPTQWRLMKFRNCLKIRPGRTPLLKYLQAYLIYSRSTYLLFVDSFEYHTSKHCGRHCQYKHFIIIVKLRFTFNV